jgi:hypothetical protein
MDGVPDDGVYKGGAVYVDDVLDWGVYSKIGWRSVRG